MKKKKQKQKRTINITVYIVLRFLVIVCMTGQVIRGNWNNVFLCFLTLLLFTIPTLIDRALKIKLPSTLEIIIYLFIFAAEILGEIQNFYGIFRHWDTILHTLNGFLMGAIGFSLIDILNRRKVFHMNLSPFFVSLFAFCFSMTIGILWEFGEFTLDRYFYKDCQKDRVIETVVSSAIKAENEKVVLDDITKTKIYSDDNQVTVIDGYLDIGLIDTMKDLFVNFLGAIVFSGLGYFYIKNREGYKFIEIFLPRLKEF